MTTADIKLLGAPAQYFRVTQVGTETGGNPTYALVVDTSSFAPTAIGAPTDKGGTITSGTVSQTAVAANTSRTACIVQNPVDATETLYVAITGSATIAGAGNFASLAPGGSCSVPGTAAVRVNATTTGHRFHSTEWQ